MPSQSTVTWGEIVAQCGNYRDGFVAIFRQHEGQLTDEIDGQGRTVKVTVRSFALHMGIAEDTFRRWVTKSRSAGDLPTPRSKNDLTRDVTRAARHEPDAVVAGIMSAPAAHRDRIFHDLKLERAGIDTSPANRKAAAARAAEAVQPILTTLARTQITFCVQALEEAKECLAVALREGAVDGAALDQINKAHDDFVIMLAEASFVVSS